MNSKILLPIILTTLLSNGYVLGQEKLLTKHTSKPKTSPVVTPKIVEPKWRTYTAPDGYFSVLLPGMPKQKKQVQKTYLGIINVEIFSLQPVYQEVGYVITYNEFPNSYAKMNSPQKIMDEAQYAELKTTQSRLISQRNIRSSNFHPGREIEYVNSIGKVTKMRMFFAHDRLYKVMAITSKEQRPLLAKTIDGYLNSFQIILKR